MQTTINYYYTQGIYQKAHKTTLQSCGPVRILCANLLHHEVASSPIHKQQRTDNQREQKRNLEPNQQTHWHPLTIQNRNVDHNTHRKEKAGQ